MRMNVKIIQMIVSTISLHVIIQWGVTHVPVTRGMKEMALTRAQDVQILRNVLQLTKTINIIVTLSWLNVKI